MRSYAESTDLKFHKQRHAVADLGFRPDRSHHSAHTQLETANTIFRKASCSCGGGCPSCQSKSSLKVSQPNDPAEIEADQIADRVMRMPAENVPVLNGPIAAASSNPIQRLQTDDAVLHRQEHDEAAEEPDPITEGLGVVAENLGENNPAFTEFTEDLANEFLSQPPALSVGVPVFLGANYAFLWGMAMANPAMRRHFNDFNIAMLPGIIPQFPIKTFTYQILNDEQTQFEFEFGLDASGLLEAFNDGVLNTRISTLSFESSGGLDTEAASPVSLSALQVNLGLFDDGILLTGGFRQGISPYPLMERDALTGETSRIGAQFPAVPDLFPERQDVRFMFQLDLVRLHNYFNPDSPPIRSIPLDIEGDRIERKPAANGDGGDVAPTGAIEQAAFSNGRTLDRETRDFFEPRLGYSLGGVRIHTGDAAAESARSVNARAYTLGRDIVFGSGEFAPNSESGRHLIAHELAHVVQASDSGPTRIFREAIDGDELPTSDAPVALKTPNKAPSCDEVCGNSKEKCVQEPGEHCSEEMSNKVFTAWKSAAKQLASAIDALNESPLSAATLASLKSNFNWSPGKAPTDLPSKVSANLSAASDKMSDNLCLKCIGECPEGASAQIARARGKNCLGSNCFRICPNFTEKDTHVLLHELFHRVVSSVQDLYRGQSGYPPPPSMALKMPDCYASLIDDVEAAASEKSKAKGGPNTP